MWLTAAFRIDTRHTPLLPPPQVPGRHGPVSNPNQPDGRSAMYGSRSRTLLGALIALLAGLLAAVPGAAAARVLHASLLSPQGKTLKAASAGSAGSDISPATVLARAQYWVNQRVPYNQGATYPASSAPTGRIGPTARGSCRWPGLSSSLTTWTLPSVATQIGYSQLQRSTTTATPTGSTDHTRCCSSGGLTASTPGTPVDRLPLQQDDRPVEVRGHGLAAWR